MKIFLLHVSYNTPAQIEKGTSMSDIYTLSMILSIGTFTFTACITPGPTNLILLSSVLNFGYKKSLPFMAAHIISYPLMMLLTGLGVGLFLTQHPSLMSFLKIIGILYLCWMALKIARDRSTYEQTSPAKSHPFTFWQAMVYPLLNPKAWIVNLSAISLFVTSSEQSLWQVGIIVLCVLVSMFITTYAWAFGGLVLRRFLKESRFIRAFNLSMASLLIISVLPFMLE